MIIIFIILRLIPRITCTVEFFCSACVSVIGERHAPAPQKVLNVPRLWQKNSNAVEPTF